MAQAKTLSVGGIGYEVIDGTARSNAQTALNNAEYNRQGQIGKYGGQNIAAVFHIRKLSLATPVTVLATAMGAEATNAIWCPLLLSPQ